MRAFVPPARLGIHYEPAGIARAIDRLGSQTARRMFLLAETFDAEALLALRLPRPPRRPGGAGGRRLDELAAELAGLAPLAVRGMKRTILELAAAPSTPRRRGPASPPASPPPTTPRASPPGASAGRQRSRTASARSPISSGSICLCAGWPGIAPRATDRGRAAPGLPRSSAPACRGAVRSNEHAHRSSSRCWPASTSGGLLFMELENKSIVITGASSGIGAGGGAAVCGRRGQCRARRAPAGRAARRWRRQINKGNGRAVLPCRRRQG